DRALRGDRTDAETAYGLATTAVLLLDRWGGGRGGRGLGLLIAGLAREPTFDAALRATYHMTQDDFESRWQRDVAQRYGWVSWAVAAGAFWATTGLVVVSLAAGYVLLARGSTTAAPILLVLGYCVFFPVGLAL